MKIRKDSLTKRKLLKNLKNNIYCRIQISKISGIGVVAIKDIPKGTDPFIGSCDHDCVLLTEKDIKSLDPQIKKMIMDFCIPKQDKILVPVCAFNGMDISHYLNHSKTPNILVDDLGLKFTSIRNIKKGEELTIDYQKYYGEKIRFTSKHP